MAKNASTRRATPAPARGALAAPGLGFRLGGAAPILDRANDDARRISDADCAEVLAFTKAAFDMAVRFRVAPLSTRAARRAKSAA